MGKRNRKKTKFGPFKISEEKESVSGNRELQDDFPPREQVLPDQEHRPQDQGGALDDLHLCPVTCHSTMKFNKLHNHIKHCAKRKGKSLCSHCSFHSFSSNKLLKEHQEICDKRPRNGLLPLAAAAPQEEEVDATSNEAAQSDEDWFQTNENAAEPEFMRKPDYKAMLSLKTRRKKSGMTSKDKDNWDDGEKRRTAAVAEKRELSRSICEDCQIPNNVRKYYNSTLQPKAETPYIPVGLGSSTKNKPRNNRRRRRRNVRAPVESDRAFFPEPSSSSPAVNTKENSWKTARGPKGKGKK